MGIQSPSSNRALACSQFSGWVEMPSFTTSLHKILKTVFDCYGIIFVWYSTDDFPSVWSLVRVWLVALSDEDVPDTFTSGGVELFREKHGFRMLRRWESFEMLTPLPKLDSHFPASTAWSLSGKIVRGTSGPM